MDGNPTDLRSLAAKSSCIQLVYEWASCEMPTINTWKDEKGYGTCPDHEWVIWQMNEMQIPGSPVMPDSIRDLIEYQITWVLEEVTDWICYHHKKNFFHDEPASPLKDYLLKLIWKSNRSIDYTETAKNILTSSNFNAMERYRFACTYCFPEDVQNLREITELADWCFKEEPLLVYWSKYYLTDQLHHTIKLPTGFVSIEVFMFSEAVEKYDLLAPIVYFFTEFYSDIKLWQFCDVITYPESRGTKYLKELLSVMDGCERGLVYQGNVILRILENLVRIRDYEGISQMYSELKGKSYWTNFAAIIVELVKASISPHRNRFNSLTSLFLLMEIWNDAIGEDEFLEDVIDLQSYIAAKCSTAIVSDENRIKYCWSTDGFHRPLEFIRALAAAYEPRNFLKSNFYWLVIWQPFASIVQLIDEFQLDVKDVEELKMHTRHSSRMKRVCLKYLESGKLDEFSAFVSFCYQDHKADISAYQKDLLTNEDGLKALADALNHIDWRIVNEFVNNVFRDVAGFVSGYTTRLLFRAFQNGEYFLMKMMKREDANGHDIVECIQTFVPDNDNLSLAKETFVDLLLKTLYNDDYYVYDDVYTVFKRAVFNDHMLNWCFGSETGVAEFKEMINVSEVFLAQFWGCIETSTISTFKFTDSMEEFLLWYYPIESERRAFKLEMIHSYYEFDVIGLHLKDRSYRRRMLNWFFENDAEAITEFVDNVSSIKFSIRCG
ncbi:uncharacterized protein LOC135837928 [Planococcus citri]|uniref:uncharacterized protein LOC135837928 n=1 Tax=Planococcus citri TaxID=170843 RepID=UPI0031F87D2E